MPITENDVRHYIQDRTAADNDLALDLSFSSEEIGTAMKHAMREWNSTGPPIMQIGNPDCLPDDTNVFFDAIAAFLLRSVLFKLTRNDVSYQAGNMAIDLEGKQIEHLTRVEKECEARFRDAANRIKIQNNLRRAYGDVG